MIPVLISTHGPTAKSLIETTEMIYGQQDLCEVASFAIGQSLESFQQQIEQKLALLTKENSTVLCLVDLKGGTPFNTLVKLMGNYSNLEIITGVNIPMLLTIFMLRANENNLNDLLPEIISASIQSIEQYNITSLTNNKSENEEF